MILKTNFLRYKIDDDIAGSPQEDNKTKNEIFKTSPHDILPP